MIKVRLLLMIASDDMSTVFYAHARLRGMNYYIHDMKFAMKMANLADGGLS